MKYYFRMTDQGCFRHFVSMDDGATWLIARDIGPGAEFAANESPGNFTRGVCPTTGPNALSGLELFMCQQQDIQSTGGAAFTAETHFSSCTILATTSTRFNRVNFSLVVTYLGFGILVTPRGCVLGLGQFLSGYTPLFDDLGFVRCGQLNTQFNYDETKSVCGVTCAKVMIDTFYDGPNSEIPMLWEMASPSGEWRLQFFDNGQVNFSKFQVPTLQKLEDVFSTLPELGPTNTNYPLCDTIAERTAFVDNSQKSETYRDKIMVRNATYSYDNAGVFLAMSRCDLSLQISDGGGLHLMKDYVTSAGNINNYMIQSLVKGSAYPLNQAQIYNQGVPVGEGPNRDGNDRS
jgi:hypothetical protein